MLLSLILGSISPLKSDVRSVEFLDNQWASSSFPGAGIIGAGFLLKALSMKSKRDPDSHIHKERTNFFGLWTRQEITKMS